MSRTAAPLILLVTFVFLLGAAPAVLASPQPDPVCGACGSSFEEIADEEAIQLNVTQSTATITVHENGSATWVVRNRLAAANATRLADHPDRVESLGQRAAADGWGLPHVYEEGTVTFQGAHLANRTLTIRFRDPDAGTRHLGILVVDYLHSDGIRGGWLSTADRFTIVGPPGTAVVNNPQAPFEGEYSEPESKPTVENRTVTWPGATGDDRWGFYEDVYVAFSDPSTHAYHADAALALATAPIWLDNVMAFVLPAAAVYAGLLVGVSALTWRVRASAIPQDEFALGIVGLGVLGLVIAGFGALDNGPVWVAGPALIYLITGSVAAVRPACLRTLRGCLGVAAASMVGVIGLTVGYGLGDPATEKVILGALYGATFLLPVVIAPAFGLEIARDRQVHAILGGTIAFALAGMVFVPYDSRPWMLVLMLTVGGAIAAAVLSLPLAALTARVSTATESNPESTTDEATAD
ncbi:hypothetical protein ACFR9U_14120 [Halorientalis brevis]|uniref:Uncharacterized protein n=1 Tax=Halorientalis brevis TaxID=1126241 RepID=A0ABD6CCQ8_9EURY|nr:hypothetical protein [Halorientalis brevis]